MHKRVAITATSLRVYHYGPLTCDCATECCSHAFCAAIVADAPLSLLPGEHELVPIVVVVHGLVVEQAVPRYVVREVSSSILCGVEWLLLLHL